MIRIKSCYRLFYKYPLLLFMLLFLIYLWRSFPYVFFLMISASPIVICTTILLALLLALGQKQAQGTKNYALKNHKFSSPWPNSTIQSNWTTPSNKGSVIDVGSSINGDGGGGGEGFLRDKFAELRKDIVEKEIKDSSSIEGNANGSDDKMQGSQGNSNVVDSVFAYDEKFPKTEFKGKEREGERAVRFMDEPRRKDEADDMGHFSSLSSSSSPTSSSEDDSDMAPKSSKDYIPTLCDYHPLEDLVDHQGLHDESPKVNNERVVKLKEMKEGDEVSSIVQEDHEEASSSDNEHKQQLEGLIGETSYNYDIDVHDDDDEEEIKDIIEEDEEEEDEEDKVKQKCIETMVNWTEEDEKNLNDLSMLELERNRQLERIMSKRIAQKTLSTVTEKSLMDLDLSDRPFSVARISTKTNPFEFNNPTSHQHKMPPIPGSAPAFFPGRNPFDDFIEDAHENKPIHHNSTVNPKHVSINSTSTTNTDHHQQNKSEHNHLEKDSAFLSRHHSFSTRHNDEREGVGQQHQDGDEASKREALFRRYQSFGVVGSSFYGFLWQENEEESSYPFRPFFAPHEDINNGSDSTKQDSSQGSVSVSSSSSRAGMEDQEESVVANSSIEHAENASERSSEVNMNKTQQEMEDMAKESCASSSSEVGEDSKSSNVADDTTHIEPVYDSYDNSPSAMVSNIFLSSDSSHQEEGRSET